MPLTAEYNSEYLLEEGDTKITQNFAIKKDNTLWGWGMNDCGQIGNGTTKMQKLPVKIMSDVVSVTQGFNYSFAIKKDGTLWAWGSNEYCQLGIGDKGNALYKEEGGYSYKIQTTPVKVMDNVSKVYTGGGLTLAIKKDGSLWGWGYNLSHLIYNGKNKGFAEAKQYKLMDNVASVELGPDNRCIFVIKKDGTLWFWGYDDDSIVTGGKSTYSEGCEVTKPTKVMDNVASIKTNLSSWVKIVAILKKDGTLWTCGYNSWGQVGNGTRKYQKKPAKILDKVKSVEISSERDTVCIAAIRTDNSLWMWGSNYKYQIGNGGSGNAKAIENIPIQTKPIKILNDVASVYIGDYGQVSAIDTDGALWVWGYSLPVYDVSRNGNSYKVSTDYFQSKPVKLMDNVVQIRNYEGTTVALKSDKTLWAWGENTFGTVGNGSLDDQFEPIMLLNNIQVVTGKFSAVTTDGTLYRWGDCTDYSLGDGSPGTDIVPVSGMLGNRNEVDVQNVPVSILTNIM